MSQAEDLLDSLSEDVISAYTAEPETEGHIIVGADRFITVPEELKRIAVQADHDVETVTFDCPRYWDEHDMSEWKVYINYMRKDGVMGCYWCEEVTVDETDSNIMHFDWTISRNVSEVKGALSFLVCIKVTDIDTSEETNHWNSELNKDMYVSEGLECLETIVNGYPDIVTQLLLRMDYVEEIATPEAMKEYVNSYYASDKGRAEIQEFIYQYLSETDPTSTEQMLGYVQHYLDEHPPLLIIGSTKPGISCMWFNTGELGTDSSVENTVVKLVADSQEASIYAEVEGESDPVYDFDII